MRTVDPHAPTGSYPAARQPAQSVVYAVLVVGALVIACLLAGGLVLGVAHASVAAKVNTIAAREVVREQQDKSLRELIETMRAEIRRTNTDSRDDIRLLRMQVDYFGKLALIGINDQRAAEGKPPLPNDFPREEP